MFGSTSCDCGYGGVRSCQVRTRRVPPYSLLVIILPEWDGSERRSTHNRPTDDALYRFRVDSLTDRDEDLAETLSHADHEFPRPMRVALVTLARMFGANLMCTLQGGQLGLHALVSGKAAKYFRSGCGPTGGATVMLVWVLRRQEVTRG